MSGPWSTTLLGPAEKVYYAGVVVEKCGCGASFWYAGEYAKAAAGDWRRCHQHSNSEGTGSGEAPASSVQTSGAPMAPAAEGTQKPVGAPEPDEPNYAEQRDEASL